MKFRVLLLTLAALTSVRAFAHPEMGNYLQHSISLNVEAGQLDLSIEIAFDAERSAEERALINTDKDDKLSKAERNAYVMRVRDEAEERVRLSINGKPARLIALYDPELDLLDSRDMERHPHVLRLAYFAPVEIVPGDAIALRDALWPEQPAMLLAVGGESDALRFIPRQSRSNFARAAHADREIVFDVAGAASLEKRRGGHVCTAACRHTMRSKGRPGGHRTE